MPVSPRALVIFECTAKGRGNWWHNHWKATKKLGEGTRFTNIFIPWFAEGKYQIPPPPELGAQPRHPRPREEM